jgi:antitoxin Xre/MbcA/ParS-like protein
MPGMAEGQIEPTTVEKEARSAFGDYWTCWMQRPNRLLDGLTPSDFTRSPEGISIVLAVLRQHKEFEKFQMMRSKTWPFRRSENSEAR